MCKEFLLKKIDKYYCKKVFHQRLGASLDFNNPKTFNEKTQWLKINYRNPLMTQLSDKYSVRDYVKEKIGESYLNDFYGIYEDVDTLEKDVNNFPKPFVLKATHWSGGNFFILDDNFGWQGIKKDLKKYLKRNYYWQTKRGRLNIKGEWNYRGIKPRIICEKYIQDKSGDLKDYKVFCFNGDPKFVEVDVGRFTDHKRAFYDINWTKQPFTTKYPLFEGEVEKPNNLQEIIRISKILSVGFPFVRIDLYNINEEKLIFGEMTFYHGSGFEKFVPETWDKKMGDLLTLEKYD